ncbi:MAG: DUF2855 family protein [Paraglaciecola sp.]|uniref:DUF2855 family protein n=1 Tax=Paraglaciecola sp. TaxID=1920173 RepID=UPI00273D9325|nr:DUF2855 family protein [Paraglaciecola sp.]MDP5032132.1 DUF2855 family protein [Paraglaciecola sp.]MDP5132564.1 DUF2855 family protein [Paraglaciecola sp.]
MSANSITTQQIWVDKSHLSQTKIVEQTFDLGAIAEGEVLLKVDTFGFSANNITYALLGDKMGYWGFFQAGEGYGIVPMWGFATVVFSNCQGIELGERLFGYLPMATHWLVKPSKVSPHGFFDAHPARKSISPVYDNYLRCAQDPGYDPAKEAIQMNIRPLFMTSFVLDDFVAEHIASDVQQLILTSASSKTAYGTAHLLHKHKANRAAQYDVIGLTSESNKRFTEQLGCYDRVLSYEQLGELRTDKSTWLLDFAGNKPLILSLQQQFSAQLARTIFIGVTDVDAQQDKPKDKVEGEMFFAPAQVKKRTQEWGQQGFAQHYAQAWQSFLALIEQRLEVKEHAGAEALQAVYTQGLKGGLSNDFINVLRF